MLREFNGLGQLTAEYQAHSGAVNTGTTPKVQYAYSEMASGANHSRLVSMTYPDGRIVTYDYGTTGSLDDRISRLNAMKDGSTTLEAYSYLGLSTVIERLHPESGVDLSYVKLSSESVGDAGDQYTGLDRFDRVVDQRWRDGTTDLDRYFYTYDRDSNHTSKLNALNSDLDEFYSYDLLNQLTAFTRADGHDQSWDINAEGNFNTVTTDGVDEDRTHNSQNEITSISGATTPTYDANGSLTTDETGRKLIYDAWNRLVEVQDASSATLVRYSYDAHGWRITEDKGSGRDFFYSSAWQVLEERTGGVAEVQYVWSTVYVDAMILRDRDTDNNGSLNERVYVTQDGKLDITAVMAAGGAILERYEYDPYGQCIVADISWNAQTGSDVDWVFGHQGLRFEEMTGLHWNRRRDYSAILMRFAQNDPVGMADGTNLYASYGDSPVNMLDPMGLSGGGSAYSKPNKFGDWEFSYSISKAEGALFREGTYCDAKITFSPDPCHVSCEEISFIQAVRVTSTSDGSNLLASSLYPGYKDRLTGNAWTIDRSNQGGHDIYGWYGYSRTGKPLNKASGHTSDTMKPGATISSAGPTIVRGIAPKDAWMRDKVKATIPNSKFEYETCAVCKSHPYEERGQKNWVYGCIKWEFTVDGQMNISSVVDSFSDKPSSDFYAAITAWNNWANASPSPKYPLPAPK